MRIVLLGTGSADGWPNPFCTCMSCASARRAGQLRANTSALVDDTVLLDCGPDVLRSAGRLGAALHDVGLVLLTHAHPDHVHGLVFLARQWANGPASRQPLVVAGPAAALQQVRPWLAPDDVAELQPLEPGGALEWRGYEVRAVAAVHEAVGAALLFDLTGPDGRVLYATDTGPFTDAMVEAVADRRYDVVLLEETFGDVPDHRTDHLDLRTFPEVVARLRQVDAVVDGTQVVAVHLSHHNPPPDELDERLRAWGARAGRDGDVLTTSDAAPRAVMTDVLPRRTLILGGARSGKSSTAQRLLADRSDVTFVATAHAGDAEMTARVARHRAQRPTTWRTVETLDVAGVLADAGPGERVLVDCFTLWLSRTMDDTGAWQSGDTAGAQRRIDDLLTSWRDTRATVVGVSNEVGTGVVPATASGRLFRDLQGQLNAALADRSDDVLLTVAGRTLQLRSGA